MEQTKMTSLPGYVDCVCITENRTTLLPKAIRCFEKQDYPAKRLFVFFTSNDTATKLFVQNNLQYNSVRMEYKTESIADLFFESLENRTKPYSSFVEGEKFYIRIGEGIYLKANGDTTVVLSAFSMNDPTLQFSLKKNANKTISIYTSHNTWLKAEKDGTLWQADECREWETFKVKASNKNFKLSTWHEFSEGENASIKMDDSFLWNTTVLHRTDSEITFVELKKENSITLGEKRNIASRFIEGDYLCVWDDDDWHNPIRISSQVESIKKSGKDACTLSSIYLYNTLTGEVYVTRNRAEGWEGTLICKRNKIGKYEHLASKEDTIVLRKFQQDNNIYTLDKPYLYIYQIHQNNTSNLNHFNYITRIAYRVAPTEDQFVKECFA